MIALLRAYLARRTRRRQIRQIEQCLAVLRPLMATPARSLDEVMERSEVYVTIAQAEWCLGFLREHV